MLSRLSNKNGKGSKFTLISIIMIILVLYSFKFALGGKDQEYPQYVYFNDQKYVYSETIKESALKFKRNYGKNYEGFVLLSKRGEGSKEAPDSVYIFEGWKKYRQYNIEK